jgi:hypothetical protein
MGRKSKNVEFLNSLRDIMDMNINEFAKAVGKKHTNISDYLSGNKIPQKRALKSIIQGLSEWKVEAELEIMLKSKVLKSVSDKPGIYALIDSSGNNLYVGQATNLKKEINQTLKRRVNFVVRKGPKLNKKNHPTYNTLATRISTYFVPSRRLRHNLEALILRIFPNQTHNNKLGNFI